MCSDYSLPVFRASGTISMFLSSTLLPFLLYGSLIKTEEQSKNRGTFIIKGLLGNLDKNPTTNLGIFGAWNPSVVSGRV